MKCIGNQTYAAREEADSQFGRRIRHVQRNQPEQPLHVPIPGPRGAEEGHHRKQRARLPARPLPPISSDLALALPGQRAEPRGDIDARRAPREQGGPRRIVAADGDRGVGLPGLAERGLAGVGEPAIARAQSELAVPLARAPVSLHVRRKEAAAGEFLGGETKWIPNLRLFQRFSDFIGG